MTTIPEPMTKQAKQELHDAIAAHLAALEPPAATLTAAPKQVKQEVDAIDARIRVLEPWVATLAAARKRYLLDGYADFARGIEQGFSREEAFPNDPALQPLAEGRPGLLRAEDELTKLRERRQLLSELLPSEEEIARARAQARKTADRTATEITKRAARLEAQTDRLRTAVKELTQLARLALDVAEESYWVWRANLDLDRACAEADIARPVTPRPENPQLPHGAALGRFLATHFAGREHYAVDPALARALRE
jgi:hypothetical protein